MNLSESMELTPEDEFPGDEDGFLWDQWGVWRTCPTCDYTWGDTYDDIESRGRVPINLRPPDNAFDCPYCHPELSSRYVYSPDYYRGKGSKA